MVTRAPVMLDRPRRAMRMVNEVPGVGMLGRLVSASLSARCLMPAALSAHELQLPTLIP